jgi:hypothetical protein
LANSDAEKIFSLFTMTKKQIALLKLKPVIAQSEDGTVDTQVLRDNTSFCPYLNDNYWNQVLAVES